MSFIAWLDTSAEQQRRAREILVHFQDKGTIDDLGLGQVRDALSDRMFPGTSTLHTRARYFLFVPWAFQLAAERRRPREVLAAADNLERTTVVTLRSNGSLRGLIGAQTGKNVKVLPSQVYWNALRTFGILTAPVSRQQIGRAVARSTETDELVDRRNGPWIATLPARPADFPSIIPEALDLSGEEAGWLQERIVVSLSESLLGTATRALNADSLADEYIYPWDALAHLELTDEQQALLDHAELFALTMQGAAFLYNVLLAEAFARGGWTPDYGTVDAEHYRELFANWHDEISAIAHRLQRWSMPSFWQSLGPASHRIGLPTRRFVETWVAAVRSGTAQQALESAELRGLITRREGAKKGPLAMLANSKRLSRWTGDSGTGRLAFRWASVSAILRDIKEGIDRAGT